DAAGVSIQEELRSCNVSGNEVLLRQLVMNLGQNAIRHNLPEAGTVRIVVSPVRDSRDCCMLLVENTGPVLDPDRIRTFTEPFVRGQGRLAIPGQRRKGHGLGLTLVAK